MGSPSYLCSVLFARAPVFGLCFYVSVRMQIRRTCSTVRSAPSRAPPPLSVSVASRDSYCHRRFIYKGDTSTHAQGTNNDSYSNIMQIRRTCSTVR